MSTLTQNRDEAITQVIDEAGAEWHLQEYINPTFTADLISKIEALEDLPKNWDCEGSLPIKEAIIEAAKVFSNELGDDLVWVPDVVPMSRENLQFDWTEGERSLELEIESPETIHYLKWDFDRGIEEEDTFPISDVEKARQLIRWFLSSS